MAIDVIFLYNLIMLEKLWLVHPTDQYEEMKKVKEDLEEDISRERAAHRHYKRECTALKDEYNNLRLKVRYPHTCTCIFSP